MIAIKTIIKQIIKSILISQSVGNSAEGSLFRYKYMAAERKIITPVKQNAIRALIF